MDLLNKLTIKNLKLNKKRTIVTIIGIMLSVALINSVATMYSSAIKSLINYEVYEKGDFHVAYYNVSQNDIATIKNNLGVEDIYLTKNIGYAIASNSKNEYKPYLFVQAFSQKALENLSVKLVEGRLPENENEIVIPTHLKTNGRINYQVGDTITLDIGTRVSDGEILTQSDSYNKESNEEIINTTSKTYNIVGIIERPANNIEDYAAPGYTIITYMNENDLSDNVNIYAKYNKVGSKNYLKVTANILGVDEKLFTKVYRTDNSITNEELEEYNKEMENAKYQYTTNSYLITLENNPLSASSVGSLGVVVIIVCLIIMVTSIFCIKNSFDISITEKIKQYGMLRSIGATKKQIRRNVFYEATILGLIGIPFGLLLGFIASYILIIISNIFMQGIVSDGLVLVLAYSWVSFLVAILLGIITIYSSAFKSARKASRVSPIESIRNSANIKINSKKIRSPKIIKKIFGMGGVISYKNQKRNKKKYRTTILTLVVSVFTFIALSSFMNTAFDEIENELNLSDYNIMLVSYNSGSDLYEKMLDTTTFDNIDNYSIIRNSQLAFKHSDSNYNKDYLDYLSLEFDPDINDYINLTVVGEEQYNKYIKSLGLSYDEVKDKAILVDYQKVGKYDYSKNKEIYKSMRIYNFEVGDVIDGTINDDKELSIEIAYVTKELPFSLGFGTYLIISDELFDEINANYRIVEIDYLSSNASKLQDDIDDYLKGESYSLNNLEENVRLMNNLYTLIGIFLYGFIIVISLIGITNIFNTITTNMYLRKQEFAMLKSIGMTKFEFNRMIRLESLFIGAKSLIFGIPIGACLSYLIYHFLSSDSGISYRLPILAIIISILAVFILIFVIMKYEMGKINKQNTIEAIRNENI